MEQCECYRPRFYGHCADAGSSKCLDNQQKTKHEDNHQETAPLALWRNSLLLVLGVLNFGL